MFYNDNEWPQHISTSTTSTITSTINITIGLK